MAALKTQAAKKSAVKNKSKKGSKSRRKSSVKNKTAIICSAAVVAMVAAIGVGYAAGRIYYSDRFLADTYINGVNVSSMTLEEAYKATNADYTPEKLVITTIDSRQIEINTADFDYERNIKSEVEQIFNEVNRGLWFAGFAGKSEYSFAEEASYDSQKLETLITQSDWGDTETADAYMELTDDGYVITQEVQGTKITDMQQLIYTIQTSLSGGEFDIVLDTQTGCYTEPSITSANYEEQCEALNKVFDLSITYDFDYTTQTLTGKELISLLNLDDTGQYSVNEDKVEEYVEMLAEKYDTYNTERTFNATLQGEITIPTSSDAKYGWWIDKELTEEALIEMLEEGESVESVDPIYYSTGYYDFTGVESARTADDDIGSTYIEIDLTDQHFWYYKDGELEYECYIVSGQTTSEARTTLPGVYKLWSKETNKRMQDSNADGDEWDTTCNYWNNVSLCGIGLHDSTWRGNAFGGTIYKWNGSHGCINMSLASAKYVYDNVELGTPVVMYY